MDPRLRGVQGRMMTSQQPDPQAAPAGAADLVALAEIMESLFTGAEESREEALDELVGTAVEHIPGARWASVTTLEHGRFRTEASSDPLADRTDLIQYEVGAGPCVDAVLDGGLFVTGDIARDERWPAFGVRAAAETGVRSVLAHRLNLHYGSTTVAGLNVYSDARHAMSEESIATGLIIATHAAAIISASMERERADHLRRAQLSNREIGVAMGILMQQHRLTRDQAFDVLRAASQDGNRKLVDVAAEVVDTGTVTLRRWPAR